MQQVARYPFTHRGFGKGELHFKEHTTRPGMHFESPYRLNAKELDEETGLYYYGARYYNPMVSVWLGVDPLATQFPHQSPYVFTDNNPIMLWDPTGMAAIYPNSAEPPINFFSRTEILMNKWFNEANNPNKYNIGDRVFSVYGHGNYHLISDRKTGTGLLIGAAQLDHQLKERSEAYRTMTEGARDFTLIIYSCLSASSSYEKPSLAQEFSLFYPEATVVGFDGFINVAPINGTAEATSISTVRLVPGPSNNDGSVVFFRNGEEINRMSLQEFQELGL